VDTCSLCCSAKHCVGHVFSVLFLKALCGTRVLCAVPQGTVLDTCFLCCSAKHCVGHVFSVLFRKALCGTRVLCAVPQGTVGCSLH
jgi:hypothetical protein